MKYTVYLDSSQSTGVRPSQAQFQLNQPLIGCTKISVLAFTFGNNLYNIVAPYNTLTFNSVTITVPPGYYTFADFISYINTALMASAPFLANLTVETKAVALTSVNQASWTIGANIMTNSPLYDVFSLYAGYNYTGNFQSSIYFSPAKCNYDIL